VFLITAGVLVSSIVVVKWSRSRQLDPLMVARVSGVGVVKTDVSRGTRSPDHPPGLRAAVDQIEAVLGVVKIPSRGGLLAELRQRLEALSATERRQLLEDFFTTQRDADLGGEFKLGAEGGLTASPTLRVWLLNELIRLDVVGAAELGRQVLAEMGSPDEWAVALRAVALGDKSEDARRLLRDKALLLLSHSPWQQQPTSGYLNAFDVAVHLKDQAFAPALSGLLRQTNQPALAHAAFLALDRLTLAAPVEFLGALQALPAEFEGREAARACFFARADATHPAQRELLEQYLLTPGRSAEEWSAFAAMFPNANQFLSHNLLTRQSVPDGVVLSRRDIATAGVVRQWLADPRFTKHEAHLRMLEARLIEFTRQAKK